MILLEVDISKISRRVDHVKLQAAGNQASGAAQAAEQHTRKVSARLPALVETLGTPNMINHAANCSMPGQVARRMTFESPFDSQARVDPDYDNVRYLLLVGRTPNASIGAAARLAHARRNHNAKVVFVDPRQPDNALAGAEWVPFLPGTDAAFLLALVREIISTGKADLEFLTAHTNGPMLIRADGLPLTQADVTGSKASQRFAVMNAATGRLARCRAARSATAACGRTRPMPRRWG